MENPMLSRPNGRELSASDPGRGPGRGERKGRFERFLGRRRKGRLFLERGVGLRRRVRRWPLALAVSTKQTVSPSS